MLNRLKQVFKSLKENDVHYLVIGGIATILYGIPRTTFDLDILIEPTMENAENLLKAFLNAGLITADLTSPEELLKNEITVFKDVVRIDVQTQTPGIIFSEAWNHKNIVNYEGQDILVVSLKDLIASKEASSRDVDKQDVALLKRYGNNKDK